jgi:protein TonB
MFDKLIESNSAAADFKPRRKFFMVSSVLVGIVFLSAVVFSLYAQDIGLGTENFELVEMLAPVVPDAPEPEPPRQTQQRQADPKQKTELPSRQHLIASIDQPQKVPTEISTTPNKFTTIPNGPFKLDPNAVESDGIGSSGPVGNRVGSSSGPSGPTGPIEPAEVVKVADPPPIVPRRSVTTSKGVINGEALDLPKPVFPATARSINLTGTVNVQVLIDETGNVVSAKAIDGHVFFKSEAERAARRAKFKPTLLSNHPVKVTGVIVYRFTR